MNSQPHVESRLVAADGLQWNISEMGQGETILLVHGTAASVHSWRDVMPLLTESYHVLAVDLPGHGKTRAQSSRDYTMDRMARGLSAVLAVLGLSPVIVAGHSAGAAILACMCAGKSLKPDRYVSFNGAFYPFAGLAGSWFSPIAKFMAINPLLPRFLSGVVTRATVERLLRDTGSTVSPAHIEHYHALFKDPKHVAAALGMMAAWDLSGMDACLSRISAACMFVAGDRDKAVPPDTADRAAAKCHVAKAVHIAGYGHLLHEEDPILAAQIIKGAHA